MRRVNWGRLAVGGLLASVIAFVMDGILHEFLIRHHWQALVERLQTTPQEHAPSGRVPGLRCGPVLRGGSPSR